MVRLLLSILIVLAGCVSVSELKTHEHPPQPSTAVSPDPFVYVADLQEDPYPGVVTILWENILIGTGVLIGPDTVLTAGHVVEFSGEYTIICDGVTHCVRSIDIHPRYKPYSWMLADYIEVDLAVVKLDTPSEVTPIQLMPKTHRTFYGEPLEVIGHGTCRKRFCNDASFWYFGKLEGSPWEFVMLPTHATIWFGDSGGAVIDDNDNVLIGIVSAFGRRGTVVSHNVVSYVGYDWDWINNHIWSTDQKISTTQSPVQPIQQILQAPQTLP